jgi:hypothetical protein
MNFLLGKNAIVYLQITNKTFPKIHSKNILKLLSFNTPLLDNIFRTAFALITLYHFPFSQAVIDTSIFPVLIEILQKAEFRTRKEATWAITNATSGGTPEQIRCDSNF